MDDWNPAMIVVRLQKTFPLRVAEWALALVMFNWGFMLYCHPGTILSRPYFANLLRIMPEDWWTAVCLTLGVVRLGALAVNGAWRATPHFRAFTAFFCGLIWLAISFGLASNELPALGLATYPVFALLDWYNVYRASADARVADYFAHRRKAITA